MSERERDHALSDADYDHFMRDVDMCYKALKDSSGLSESWVANTARSRLQQLDPSINPEGPNVPMVNSLTRILGVNESGYDSNGNFIYRGY